jgi:hypothetical protein
LGGKVHGRDSGHLPEVCHGRRQDQEHRVPDSQRRRRREGKRNQEVLRDSQRVDHRKDVKRDISVRQKRVVHGRQHLAGGEMVTFSTGLIWVVSVASGERQSVDPGERRSYQPHRTQRTDQVRSPPSQTCLLRVQTDGEQPRRRSETSEVSPQ